MTGYTTVKTGVQFDAEFDAWRNSEGQIEMDYTVWLESPLELRVKFDDLPPEEQQALFKIATRKVEEEEAKANLP